MARNDELQSLEDQVTESQYYYAKKSYELKNKWTVPWKTESMEIYIHKPAL